MLDVDDVEVERYSPLMWWFYGLPGVRLGIIKVCRLLPDAGARWVMNVTPFGMCLVAQFRKWGELDQAHGLRHWLWTGHMLTEAEAFGSSLDEPCGSAEQRPQRVARNRPQKAPRKLRKDR